MLQANEKTPVSWKEAYKIGFTLAANHKVLTLIAVFAILCERSLSLFVHFSGISIAALFNRYKEMAASISKDPLGQSWDITQHKELTSFFPVAAALFVIGAFFLVGILGLIRDLLVKQGCKAGHVMKRGKKYFWPVVRFKLPIYLILGIVFIFLAALPGGLFTAVIVYGIIFFFFRIFLSLGPKIIVTGEIKKVFPLYNRIVKLVYPFWQPVMIFYTLMFVLVGFTIILPFGLKVLGIPFVPLTIISVLILSFLTVTIKASSFSLYLQLQHLQSPPAGGGEMSIKREPQPKDALIKKIENSGITHTINKEVSKWMI